MKRTTSESTSLAEAFAPLAPSRETDHRYYVNEIRRILRLFDEMLGRPATLADLNVGNVAQFGEHLTAKRNKASTVNHACYLLRKIWRQLHAANTAGVAPPIFTKRKRLKQPRKPRPFRTPPVPEMLSPSSVLAELYGDGAGSRTRWVLQLFDNALGHKATVKDLATTTLKAFRERMLADGYSEITSKVAWQRVGRLWRFLYQHAPAVVAVPPEPDFRPKRKPPGRKPIGPVYPEPTDAEARRRDLRSFFDGFYQPRRLLGRSDCTVKKYKLVLRQFDRFLCRRSTLDDLTDETLCRYLQNRLSLGKSPHSVAGERSNLVALANAAAKKRLIVEFVEVPKTPEPDITPEAWSIAELQRLLAVCERQAGTVDGLPAAEWWTALHLFVLDSGERASAALSLEWAWVDRLTGWVTIPAGARKGKLKSMRYKLRAESLEAINRLWRSDRERVFLERDGLTVAAFYDRYKKLLERNGFPSGRRFKLQRMRRTFASLVEKAGGDATRALAHSSRRITERSYLDEKLIDRPPSSVFVERALGLAFSLSVVAAEAAEVVGLIDDELSLPLAEVVN